MEDLSGIRARRTSDWLAADALGDGLRASCSSEVGRYHAPFLRRQRRGPRVRAPRRSRPRSRASRWVQKPFPYQGKCLRWLRESHAALDGEARERVDRLLAGTGCEALFA